MALHALGKGETQIQFLSRAPLQYAIYLMFTVKETNICDTGQWLEKFKTTDVFKSIQHSYSHVVSNYQEMSLLKAILHDNVHELPRRFTCDYQVLDTEPYYYLDLIMKDTPSKVLDLGCGRNVFKLAYPQIIGMDCDPEYSTPDVFDHFDQDYVQGHRDMFDAVIAINSIHFAEIDQLTQRLQWVSDIVRPGGRGFVSFCLETWLMCTPAIKIIEIFGGIPTFADVVEYINQCILDTHLNFVVVDWPVLRATSVSRVGDDYNGNIRLVFQK